MRLKFCWIQTCRKFCSYKLLSCSSHIFVFWFFMDRYQKTKISAVKFVYFFFNSSKPVLTEKFFGNWPMRNLFSQWKVNVKKIDSWYFGLLVAIKTKIWDDLDKWSAHHMFSPIFSPFFSTQLNVVIYMDST